MFLFFERFLKTFPILFSASLTRLFPGRLRAHEGRFRPTNATTTWRLQGRLSESAPGVGRLPPAGPRRVIRHRPSVNPTPESTTTKAQNSLSTHKLKERRTSTPRVLPEHDMDAPRADSFRLERLRPWPSRGAFEPTRPPIAVLNLEEPAVADAATEPASFYSLRPRAERPDCPARLSSASHVAGTGNGKSIHQADIDQNEASRLQDAGKRFESESLSDS